MKGYVNEYCTLCGVKHEVKPTKDSSGKAVSMYCTKQRKVYNVTTKQYNGVDVPHVLKQFIPFACNLKGVGNLSPYSLDKLAKKVTYQLLDTDLGRRYRLNFAFTYYYASEILNEYAKGLPAYA